MQDKTNLEIETKSVNFNVKTKRRQDEEKTISRGATGLDCTGNILWAVDKWAKL